MLVGTDKAARRTCEVSWYRSELGHVLVVW